MPVATVPKPFTEKTRSMGRRKWPAALFSGTARAARASSPRRSSSPAPVTELTGTMAAPSRNEPGTNSSTSSRTRPRMSASTRSALVSAMTPRAYAQQAADIEMLARLRLDGFVGGDHEQHQVDAAHAGQHVLDEALVAGDIDEAEPQRRA